MRDHLDRLGDAAVAVITFSQWQELAAYRDRLALPFPVLSDPDRTQYRAFGLGRGTYREVYGLGTIRLYTRLIRRGRRFRLPDQDTLQLGGDAVIGRDGRLRYVYRSRSPDTRPAVADLVAAVERAG